MTSCVLLTLSLQEMQGRHWTELQGTDRDTGEKMSLVKHIGFTSYLNKF